MSALFFDFFRFSIVVRVHSHHAPTADHFVGNDKNSNNDNKHNKQSLVLYLSIYLSLSLCVALSFILISNPRELNT